MNLSRHRSPHVSIGDLLVELGLITQEQLIRAIETKLRSTPGQLIGEVLIAQGAVTRSQLERALSQQRRDSPPVEELHRKTRDLLAKASDSAETLHRQIDNLTLRMQHMVSVSDRQ